MPRLRSRRFPVKVMFMGIVAPPFLEQGFDGKIFLQRVCEEYFTAQNSHNQQLSLSYEVNYELKKGDWKQLFEPEEDHTDILVHEALDIIDDTYDMDPTYEIVFSYKTFSSTGKTSKWICLGRGDGYLLKNRVITNKRGNTRNLKWKDLTLHRNIKPGTKLCRDTTCDLEFMLSHIDDIGQAIRTKYHWVDKKVPIYLFMDNAGGHGTTDTKQQYENILKTKVD